MNYDKRDICNVCGKPFLKDNQGNWLSHGHKLKHKYEKDDE